MVKAAGVAGGALLIAIGLSAMLGGADLFAPPTAQGHTLSQPPPPHPSPQARPSTQPTPPAQAQVVTAAGTIYTNAPPQGGGKKKHGKG